MTKWRPKDAKVSSEESAKSEAGLRGQMEQTETRLWSGFLPVWLIGLKLHPKDKNRLVVHGLRLCIKRSDPPPEYLVDHIAAELETNTEKRSARTRRREMIRAAVFLVRNPRIKNNRIAEAAQVPAYMVTRWRKENEFWQICQEIEARRRALIETHIFREYIAKFGDTFDYGDDEPALFYAVPLMEAALRGDGPPVDQAALRAAFNKHPEPVEETIRRLSPVAR